MDPSFLQLQQFTHAKLQFYRLLSSLLSKKDALKAVLRPRSRLRAGLPDNQFLMESMLDLRQQAGAVHNSQQAGCYNRIIKALRQYPLPIKHPLQAMHLKGVGSNMVNRLYKVFKQKGIPFKTMRWPEKAKTRPVKTTKTIRQHEKMLGKIGVDIDEEAEKINESIPKSLKLGKLQHPDVEWRLLLVADSREREELTLELEGNVGVEWRSLSIGDFIWVVQVSYRHQGCLIRKEEYVLDYLVERKTTKDLISSNFSTHLNEQLSRMQKCALLKPYLLLEGDLTGRELALSLQTNHRLAVLQCRNRQEMLSWLQFLTKEILISTENLLFHELRDRLSYDSFTLSYRKTVTLREIFTEQIRQLRGISAGKVMEVVKMFTSFAVLSREMRADTETTIAKLRKLGLAHETVEAVGDLILGNS